MNTFSSFDFDRSTRKFRIMWRFIIIGIVLMIVGMVTIAVVKTSNGEKVSTITIHTFNGDNTYMCTDYKIDSIRNCITFTDFIGVKRTACNNFTISTY